MVRKMLVKVLRRLGSVVDEAGDGQEAIDLVRAQLQLLGGEGRGGAGGREGKEQEEEEEEGGAAVARCYDVILMDSVMHRVSGLEATEAIVRRLGFRGLVVGVTGNILPEDTEGGDIGGGG
jgi:CheY-like chemotaxis protein